MLILFYKNILQGEIKMRKILSLLVVCFILMASLSTNILASADNNQTNIICNGDADKTQVAVKLTNQQQIDQVKNDSSLSQSQKNMAINKLTLSENILSEVQASSGVSTENSLTYADSSCIIPVPYYRQLYGNYCGPATTQQTLTYFNGTSPSQDTIAAAFGMVPNGAGVPNGTDVPNYINARESSNYYLARVNEAEAQMQTDMINDINIYGPTILRIAPTTQYWQYNSAGHYLNVSGEISTTTFEVTDPFIQYIVPTNTSGKYDTSLYDIWTVTQLHPAKTYYY